VVFFDVLVCLKLVTTRPVGFPRLLCAPVKDGNSGGLLGARDCSCDMIIWYSLSACVLQSGFAHSEDLDRMRFRLAVIVLLTVACNCETIDFTKYVNLLVGTEGAIAGVSLALTQTVQYMSIIEPQN
jgi:hypothetical protein